MEISQTVKETLEKKLPCPICGNTDYRKCAIKVLIEGRKEFGIRVICKNEIPVIGHCGTDLTFETDEKIEKPLYGGLIPIPSPHDQRLGILFIERK